MVHAKEEEEECEDEEDEGDELEDETGLEYLWRVLVFMTIAAKEGNMTDIGAELLS